MKALLIHKNGALLILEDAGRHQRYTGRVIRLPIQYPLDYSRMEEREIAEMPCREFLYRINIYPFRVYEEIS
jgi:hypothetical protein